MNWSALIAMLGPMILEWLKNRQPRVGASEAGPVCTTASTALMSDADAEMYAIKIERELAKVPTKAPAPTPVPTPAKGGAKGSVAATETHEAGDGLIQQFRDLAVALRAKEWVTVKSLIMAIIDHL